ncbi:hypothetical protein Ae201684P_020822 [Aphanomyces euteiches]|nr:hypothetical protein Ae201684P_020822 [Aphanomyces euteiches]
MAPKRSAAAAKKVVNGSKVLWRGVPVTAHGMCTSSSVEFHLGRLLRMVQSRKPFNQAREALAKRCVEIHSPLKFPAIASSRPVAISMDFEVERPDLKDKRTLLSEEGVKFADNKVAADCMYAFTPEDIKVLAE